REAFEDVLQALLRPRARLRVAGRGRLLQLRGGRARALPVGLPAARVDQLARAPAEVAERGRLLAPRGPPAARRPGREPRPQGGLGLVALPVGQVAPRAREPVLGRGRALLGRRLALRAQLALPVEQLAGLPGQARGGRDLALQALQRAAVEQDREQAVQLGHDLALFLDRA